MTGEQGDVAAGAEVREKPAILEDIPDPEADRPGGGRGHVRLIELNRPRIGFDQPDQQSQQRAFAAAARADQHRCFPGGNVEGDRAECGAAGESFHRTVEVEHQATETPFQNATWPAMFLAASLGVG